MDTGHYKSFVRQQYLWFSCDDHNISLVDLESVLACNAYMCFYVKDFVEYSPVSDENLSVSVSDSC